MSFLKVLGGCINAVLALFAALLLFGAVIDRVVIYRFKRRYRGKWLFVAGSRHGWYDFIRNNVVPVLPADTEFILRGATASTWTSLRLLRITGAKPLLVHVTQRGEVKQASLHEQLLPLWQRAARDAEVQREVDALIGTTRARLIASD